MSRIAPPNASDFSPISQRVESVRVEMSSALIVMVEVPAALKRTPSAWLTMIPEIVAVPATANGTPGDGCCR